MPANKKTRKTRVAEEFGRQYRVGKARADMTEDQIATAIGFDTRPPLLRRRNNPLEFTLGQILTMGSCFGWTDDNYLAIIRAWKS